MQIFRKLAGYSLARADLVRRAMAKKKADVLLAERERFLDGCRSNHIDETAASKIFDEMESFASYAFNKSHATAYAMITYRTAYLKKHYPAAYMAALLTSVLGNTAKVAEYISEAGKRGIRVLPPDVNQSEMHFHVCGRDIRFGLLALKNVGISFAECVIEERKKNGLYRSFEGFLSRISERELGKRQIEMLIKSGALDSFGVYRSRLLAVYEMQIENLLARKRGNIAGQIDMFSVLSDEDDMPSVEYPDIPEFSPKELLLLEKESSGMYFSGHLLDGYKRDIESEKHDEISDILLAFEEDAQSPSYREKSEVTLCGIITQKTAKNTKNGAVMAFLTLEDRYAELEVIVFPKQYEKYQGYLQADTAVRIKGTLTVREDDGVKVLASEVSLLRADTERCASSSPSPKKLYLRVPSVNAPEAREALSILRLAKGDGVVLFYESETKKYVAPKEMRIAVSEKLLGALRALLGADNVIYQ